MSKTGIGSTCQLGAGQCPMDLSFHQDGAGGAMSKPGILTAIEFGNANAPIHSRILATGKRSTELSNNGASDVSRRTPVTNRSKNSCASKSLIGPVTGWPVHAWI